MNVEVEKREVAGGVQHRLIDRESGQTDEWRSYSGLSRLTVGEKNYFAVGPYYEAVFPAYVPIEWQEVQSE